MNYEQKKILLAQLEYLASIVRSEFDEPVIEIIEEPVVVEPDPKQDPDSAQLVSFELDFKSESSACMISDFDRNCFARIAYRAQDEDDWQYTFADTTGKWGGEIPHRQWIHNLTPGMLYEAYTQTSNDGSYWWDAGDSIKFIMTKSGSNYPSSKQLPLKFPSSMRSILGDISGTWITKLSEPNERYDYSKKQALNADGTVIYLRTKARRVSDGAQVANLGQYIQSDNMPSLVDPDVFWGIAGTWIVKGSLERQGVERIVDIGVACTVGDGEGSISNDDRYLPIASHDKQRLYVVDLKEERVAHSIAISEGLNGFGISQNGKYLTWVISNVLYRSNRDFSEIKNTGLDSQHADYGVDVNDDQVYVHLTDTHFTILNLRTGFKTRRYLTEKHGGGHVSCRNINRPGWAYFSTYDGRLFAVKLDYEDKLTYEDWGFHRHGSIDYKKYDYNAIPTVMASHDGDKVLYISTWDKTMPLRVYCNTR